MTRGDKPVTREILINSDPHETRIAIVEDKSLAELLVERAIDFLRKRSGVQYILDLCTGCGPVAAAIAKNYGNCRIIATDICDKALATAAENINTLKLAEKVKLLCGDLFDPIIEGLDQTRFDLIVSNPPYVSDAEYKRLDKKVRDYEPKQALYGGADGLDIYRRIIARVADFLKPDAAIMFEIGFSQGPAVKEMLEQTGLFAEIKIEKDPAGNDRVAIAKR